MSGADYERSRRYAEGFRAYIHEMHPDIGFDVFIGYSMEHPFLIEALEDFKRNDSVNGTFLQMGGLKMRTDAEIAVLPANLMEHGVKRLGCTFYGTREYHDAFSGRRGDFDYLTGLMEGAAKWALRRKRECRSRAKMLIWRRK